MMGRLARCGTSFAFIGSLTFAASDRVMGQEIAPRNRLVEMAFQEGVQTATAQTAQTAAREQSPLTLQAALALARATSQQLRAATTAAELAAQDRGEARAA